MTSTTTTLPDSANAPGTTLSTIRRAADHPAMPWKNGGGTTRELQVCPAGAGIDDFLWRASLAEVASDGPFSFFDGIERTLVLLDGAGFTLQFDEHDLQVLDQPFQVIRFAGEQSVMARLRQGPARDFNLMVRRGAAQGDLTFAHGPGSWSFDSAVSLLYCAQGTAELSCRDRPAGRLDRGDVLQIAATEAGLWQANAPDHSVLIVLRITPLSQPGASL